MTLVSDLSSYMTRSLLVVAALTALSMVAAVALLPSTEEKVAVLAAHHRYDEAVSLLESRRVRAGLSPYEVFTLAGMYRITQRPGPAIDLLEHEAAVRPGDGWALGLLAVLYRGIGDRVGEAKMLQQSFLVQPNAATYRRLMALQRLAGDRAQERDLIAQAQAVGLASAADGERLQHLLGPNGLDGEAAVWSVQVSTEAANTIPTLAALE